MMLQIVSDKERALHKKKKQHVKNVEQNKWKHKEYLDKKSKKLKLEKEQTDELEYLDIGNMTEKM